VWLCLICQYGNSGFGRTEEHLDEDKNDIPFNPSEESSSFTSSSSDVEDSTSLMTKRQRESHASLAECLDDLSDEDSSDDDSCTSNHSLFRIARRNESSAHGGVSQTHWQT
jgi:hypothetical protein